MGTVTEHIVDETAANGVFMAVANVVFMAVGR